MLVLQRHIPQVIGVIDHAAERVIAAQIVAMVPQPPYTHEKVLVFPEMRRLVSEIHPAHPAAGSRERIAGGRNHADRRLRKDVLFDAHHPHRCVRLQRIDATRAHGQGAEVGIAHPAVQFAADRDGDLQEVLFLPLEADPATEERNEVIPHAQAELEDVRALEKEGSLFGEEEIEARQIRLPGIHLGFAEIRVDRQRAQQIGAQPLRRIQAAVRLVDPIRGGRGPIGVADDPGPNRQPQPEIECGQVGEQSGVAGLIDLVVAISARPATGFEQPLHTALYVESPAGEALLEAQALDRNADFGAPSTSVARRRRLPDSIPVGVDVFALRGHEPVEPRPVRIDREHVARPPILERIEHDQYVISQLEIEVARLGEGDDARRVGVATDDPNDDLSRSGEDLDDRLTGGNRALFRLDRDEVHDGVGSAPRRLVQPAI